MKLDVMKVIAPERPPSLTKYYILLYLRERQPLVGRWRHPMSRAAGAWKHETSKTGRVSRG